MLWPIVLLTTFGLVVAGKSKPKTTVNKRQAFGARSGETWDVEEFPDAKLLVVHSRRGDRTLATFHSETVEGRKRFKFDQGKGNPTLIAMMRSDFEGES